MQDISRDKIILNEILHACSVRIEDASGMTQEEFAMSRREGLGASDASVILGLQAQWRKTADIIKQKLETTYTEEEAAIGKKLVVRLGNYLEPYILELFEEATGIQLLKPTASYSLKEFPFLTINYDGVGFDGAHIFPVEAKTVSLYGDKYYNWEKSAEYNENTHITAPAVPRPHQGIPSGITIVQHCEKAKEIYGVPSYYYAQIQQQFMGLPNAKFGYLAAYRTKTNRLHYFKIYPDERVQSAIAVEGNKVWNKILDQRK